MLVAIFFVVWILPVPIARRRTGTDLFGSAPQMPPGFEGKTRIFSSQSEAELYQSTLQEELKNGLCPLMDGEPDFGVDPNDFCAAMAPAYLAGDDFTD